MAVQQPAAEDEIESEDSDLDESFFTWTPPKNLKRIIEDVVASEPKKPKTVCTHNKIYDKTDHFNYWIDQVRSRSQEDVEDEEEQEDEEPKCEYDNWSEGAEQNARYHERLEMEGHVDEEPEQTEEEDSLIMNLCCFCNLPCNICSQTCGRCARDMWKFST